MSDRQPEDVNSAPPSISFTNPEVQACPFALYDRLRVEQPVFIDPVTGHYVLTRYRDVRSVATDFKQMSNRTGVFKFNTSHSETAAITAKMFAERGFPPMDTLVTNDPPEHKLYRSLVDKAFSPAKIDRLEVRMREIATSLIDDIIDRPEVEFVSEFAVKLPMIVIAEQLDVEAADMDRFKYWSDCGTEATNPMVPPDREIAAADALIEMQQYMAERAGKYLAAPDDSKLLSRLVHAEIEGRRLNTSELTSILQQLLVAGNETTTAAIAGGMKLLMENPTVIPRLRNAPAKIRTFVEETLRLMAPVQCLFRRATSSVEVGETTIPEGAIVEIRYGAANRDPSQFANPARLDIDRENANMHMTFGSGIHTCIGNQLARGELRIAFECLIERLGNFRASRGETSFAYTPFLIAYGLTTLWLSFDRVEPVA